MTLPYVFITPQSGYDLSWWDHLPGLRFVAFFRSSIEYYVDVSRREHSVRFNRFAPRIAPREHSVRFNRFAPRIAPREYAVLFTRFAPRIAPREYAVLFTRFARSSGLIYKNDLANHGIKKQRAQSFRVFRGYRVLIRLFHSRLCFQCLKNLECFKLNICVHNCYWLQLCIDFGICTNATVSYTHLTLPTNREV